jgi:hypothetical protein
MDGFGLSKIGMTPAGYLTYIYIYLTTEIGDANFNIMLRAKDSKPAPTQKLAAKYV